MLTFLKPPVSSQVVRSKSCKTTFNAHLKIDAIHALYPESFCNKNLAIRKVFAFCDSANAITNNALQWMDGLTSGYRVATALRIVYWPTPFLTRLTASRSGWLFQLTIPPKVTIAEKA